MPTSSEATIGVLMPAISSTEMFSERYQGLERELGLLGVTTAFAFTHGNYDQAKHQLQELKTSALQKLYAVPEISVVRDLTVPKNYEHPIYLDDLAPRLMHQPAFNQFLRRKDQVYELLPDIQPISIVTNNQDLEEAAAVIPGYRVIIKPLVGAGAKNVRVVRKKDITPTNLTGNFLVQEFIDNSKGDPKLGIRGTHNLRLISIGSELVGAVARVGGRSKTILRADGHGEVFEPDRLPDEVHDLADTVHRAFKELPGDGQNVIGIDLMYGKSKGQEERYVVCEINHRPVRISPYDLRRNDTADPDGMLWLGREWDKAEAGMLAEAVAA